MRRIARPRSSSALAAVATVVSVLVLVFETGLMKVGMGVHLVAVAVFVLMLDVVVLVRGVRVRVLGSVRVLVLVSMRMVVAVVFVCLVHGCASSLVRAGRNRLGRRRGATRAADADDRKVGEAGVKSEPLSDRLADEIELPGGQCPHGAATLAIQVLLLAIATKRVEAGSVPRWT